MTFPWQRRAEIALLTALTLAALAVRAYRINETSLAEDEASKLAAAREYRQGHFSGVNAEHPMLLKLMIWGSLEVGDRVSRTSPAQPWPQGRVELWLRLPNVILGAATTLLIYLLGLELMGTSAAGMIVGGLGAFFWAFLPIPIALNRVAKEDTPLTFFTVLAVYFYARAKHAPAKKARRWTDATGAAFGFALASKYIFHIFGLNALVWHVAGHEGIDRQPLGKYFWRMTAIMVAVFIVLNPVLLSPHNLLNALGYAKGAEVHHNGYNLDGQLYMNTAALTPYGVPWYFYAWV
ncbi:MAG TPA: phospholipid carrier-dependent glycosyltransferase, partial [Patescibacteria group bacterium]|nr:phospholipid carrier-dependent glycosyltransferase [Patescibacteria group bacterium]